MTECKRCGACCRTLMLTLDVKNAEEEEFYRARGLTVKAGMLFILLDHRCPHLTRDNLCDIHEMKPAICKAFPGEDNLFIPEGCAWEEKK